jgi:putative membrane protein
LLLKGLLRNWLAANQGLRNGFLALALVWRLIASDPARFELKLHGSVCVIVAGSYGAATANKRIIFAQVLPGVVALTAMVLSR